MADSIAKQSETEEFCKSYVASELIEEPEDLDALIQEHQKQSPGLVFLLLSTDWCPDCVRGSPRVFPALAAVAQKAQKHATLLKLDCGKREQWRSPDHAYRFNPLLHTKSIPTLYHVGSDGKVLDRLVEAALYAPQESLPAFLEKAFQR